MCVKADSEVTAFSRLASTVCECQDWLVVGGWWDHDPPTTIHDPLFAHHQLRRLVVLVADELDQLTVWHDRLIYADAERLRVRLRIVDRHIDLQHTVVQPPEPLGDLCG